jgi:hypothetical protein
VRTLAEVCSAAIAFAYRSIDRLILDVYIPTLQTPGAMAIFLRQVCKKPILSGLVFKSLADRFVAQVRAFAQARHVPITYVKGPYAPRPHRPTPPAAGITISGRWRDKERPNERRIKRPVPDLSVPSALPNLPDLPDRKGRRSGPHSGVQVPRALEERIVGHILAGATPRAAAVAAGLRAQTFDEWMRRGRRADDRPATPRLVKFAERIDRAIATAQVAAEQEVRKSHPLEWLRAAARDVWTDRRQLAVAPGPPEDMEIRIVYEDQERRMAEAIARSPDATLALTTILDAAFSEETGTNAAAEGAD